MNKHISDVKAGDMVTPIGAIGLKRCCGRNSVVWCAGEPLTVVTRHRTRGIIRVVDLMDRAKTVHESELRLLGEVEV